MRKKVGFLYDPDEDAPHNIANEMVENLSLNMDEADFIATMIQNEVTRFGMLGGQEVREGEGEVVV